jgi:four helix bundle protein
MREPSERRKRTLALRERALTFSNNVNQSYPASGMNYPSEIVWNQLVRAADSTSNNLAEAGGGISDADFLHKMRVALREASESCVCLAKIRRGPLANAARVIELGLEQEADELSAIFSTIITNMERRIERDKADAKTKRRKTDRLRADRRADRPPD